MIGKKRLVDSIRKLSSSTQEKEILIPGVLGLPIGEGQNTVQVEGREGFVYVRLRDNLNEVIQAYNDQVSPVYGLPVLVMRDEINRNTYRVVSRELSRYADWGSSPYLPNHGNQHSFDVDSGGGGDVVWVHDRQFMPFLITPSGSNGADSVIVQGATYYRDGVLGYAGNTGTFSFAGCKPTGGHSAKMATVYIDEFNNPGILCGTEEFDESITGTSQVIPFINLPPDRTNIPIGAVRIVSGTSPIRWDNIYDIRTYLNNSTVAGAPGGSNYQVQYNNSGTFGGADVVWKPTGYGYYGLGVNNNVPQRDLVIGDATRNAYAKILASTIAGWLFSNNIANDLDNEGYLLYDFSANEMSFGVADIDDVLVLSGTDISLNVGLKLNEVRVTANYTVEEDDCVVFGDTDGGSFTVNLRAGISGKVHKIVNVGSSGNSLTVDGNGAEKVMGALTKVLADGESIIIVYNSTEGWW